MKRLYIIVTAAALAALTMLLSACGKPAPAVADAPAATQATSAPTVPATEAAEEVETEAPTVEEIVTDKPEIILETEPEIHEEVNTSDPALKRELTNHKWRLCYVLKDGQQIMPNVQYGSVINQSGAYIQFREDDTFTCILGVVGCEGTYSAAPGKISAHIHTVHGSGPDGASDADEDAVMSWNLQQGDIQFDFNGVTNVFTVV